MLIVVKFGHSLKTGYLYDSIVSQFVALKFMEVNLLQFEKAASPMLVTDSGMVTEVKPLQPEKAESPMLLTDPGMVTEVNSLQLQKAQFPIDVTEFGMVKLVKPAGANAIRTPFLTKHRLLSDGFIPEKPVKLLHSKKAFSPIEMTDEGIVIYKIICNGGRVDECCIMLHYT